MMHRGFKQSRQLTSAHTAEGRQIGSEKTRAV